MKIYTYYQDVNFNNQYSDVTPHKLKNIIANAIIKNC